MAFYQKTKVLDKPLSYCPGCTHGIATKMVAEVIDELGIQSKTIGIAPVGCAVFAYNFFNVDMCQAAHGRAPAMATGVKRVRPESIVFAYQGDGDLASIGIAETVHAAARNENITVIFINNGIYGMTGGQMAPTTLMGAKTTTSQYGRSLANGYPLKVCEMLAQLDGPTYIERASLHDVKHAMLAKKAIKKAFVNQIENKGFSFIELLSTCPTNWGLTPVASLKYIEEKVVPYYPLGVYRDLTKNNDTASGVNGKEVK